ncbi:MULTISPECIES: ABC transporter substrate-binding protein [Paracoccus]|uniref:ABC transporter substrate-binding protein n=1 Tax=Paracoccus TaxID=265 RepID=UPI00086919AB|nr:MULTISPECIES: ABC transporter substrate-binding protein [Paracoccus]ODT58569.1 MAG: ABC transporter substrate-binding protein [Paracoccus sp. SCN 68-21]
MTPISLTRALLGSAAISLAALSPALAQTEITFFYPVQVGGPLTEVVDGYVAEFEAQNPDITVEAIYSGSYTDTTTRALTAARSGTPPTVAVMLATDIFTLIDAGVIAPLDDHITTPEDQAWLDGFMPAYLASARLDGHVWGAPFQRSTAVMYYNKEAYAAAGLDPETPPATWDEMVEHGRALTVRDASGTVTQWGLGIPGSSNAAHWLFGALVAQNGGQLSSEDGLHTFFDSPEVVGALEYWVSLGAEHGIHPPGVLEWGTTPSDFMEGRLAMAWTTTGNLGNIRANAPFDFGVAAYPGNPDPASVLGGGNLYLFADASDEEKAAAFRFIKHMTSDELLADWGIQTGYVAPRDGSWDTQALQDYVAEVPQADVARRQIAVSVPEISTYEGHRVNEVLNAAIQAALTGQQSPADALTAAQAEAERILAVYRD